MREALLARRALGPPHGDALRLLGSTATVRVTECPPGSAFELQFAADDGETAAALANACGLDLTCVNHAVTMGETTALWLGPGDWLIKPRGDPASVREALARIVASTPSSLVDVSDLWFGVSLEGARSRDLLAKGSSLDLDATVFGPGATAVTQFARLRALIHHVGGSPDFDVYVERSYAAYLWAWLVDATNEFFD